MLASQASACCKTCAMGPSIDPVDWTYTDYVCFLNSHGFHDLEILDNYLQWGSDARYIPQIRQPRIPRHVLLEFSKAGARISNMSDLNKLRLLVLEWTRKRPPSPSNTNPAGRILLVEDISPGVIDTLGGILNINPMFFAQHLCDTPAEKSFEPHSNNPLTSISKEDQSTFFTIDYPSVFLPVGCGKDFDYSRVCLDGNYRRKLEIPAKQGRNKVAIATRKISYYLKNTGDSWLCMKYLKVY